MKKLFPVLFAGLLIAPGMKAQSFSSASSLASESLSVTSDPYRTRHLCAVTIVGIPLASLGACTIIYGALADLGNSGPNYPNGNQAGDNRDRVIRSWGGIVIIAGVGMIIGGSIHDHHAAKKQRFGFVSPNGNDAGFAYNFR